MLALRQAVRLCRLGSAHVRWQSGMASSVVNSSSSQTTQEGLLRNETPFARARVGPFFQAEPQLGNQFTEDVTLQKYLRRHMPSKVSITSCMFYVSIA